MRFIARPGKPVLIISDNGGNLVKGYSDLVKGIVGLYSKKYLSLSSEILFVNSLPSFNHKNYLNIGLQ